MSIYWWILFVVVCAIAIFCLISDVREWYKRVPARLKAWGLEGKHQKEISQEQQLFEKLKTHQALLNVLTDEALKTLLDYLSRKKVLILTATFSIDKYETRLSELEANIRKSYDIISIMPNANSEEDQIAFDIIVAVEPDAEINIEGVQIEQMYP